MKRAAILIPSIASTILVLVSAAPARSSPGGDAPGTIVYESWTALWGWTSSDLYAVTTDGSAPRQLTDGSASELEPEWSPDGNRLAYASDTDSTNVQVYVADADAQNPRRITKGSKSWTYPSWSPDGKKLALEGTTAGRDYESQIYTMNADGTGLRRITDTGWDRWPEWSPDGKWISMARYDWESYAFHLYLVRPDGTRLKRLTGGRLSVYGPTWSPDSRYIAFMGWTDESVDYNEINEPGHLYVIDVAMGKIRQLIDGLELDERPCWSPDGTRIAFARSTAHVGIALGYFQSVADLFVINVDGSGLKQLTHSPHTVEQACDWK